MIHNFLQPLHGPRGHSIFLAIKPVNEGGWSTEDNKPCRYTPVKFEVLTGEGTPLNYKVLHSFGLNEGNLIAWICKQEQEIISAFDPSVNHKGKVAVMGTFLRMPDGATRIIIGFADEELANLLFQPEVVTETA